MDIEKELTLTSSERALEIFVALAKGGLSLVPGGGLVSEVGGVLIPDKQEERITKMLIYFAKKVESIEKTVLEQRLKDPDFQELYQDCKYEAARTAAQRKLKAIAQVLASGVNPENNYSLSSLVLGIVSRLSDLELLLVKAASNPNRYYMLSNNDCCILTGSWIGDEYRHENSQKIEPLANNSIKHLQNENLIKVNQLDNDRTYSASFESYTMTELGLMLADYLEIE